MLRETKARIRNKKYELACRVAISLLTLVFVTPSKQLEISEPVSACEVIQDRAPFAGKLVRLRGHVEMLYGSLFLLSPQCPSSVVVVFPEEISPKPDFESRKNANYKEFKRAVAEFKGGRLELKYKIDVVLLGRLDWAGYGENGCRQGFGHSEKTRWRLVIREIEKISKSPENVQRR